MIPSYPHMKILENVFSNTFKGNNQKTYFQGKWTENIGLKWVKLKIEVNMKKLRIAQNITGVLDCYFSKEVNDYRFQN